MGIIRLLLAIAVCNSHFEITCLPLVDGHEAVLTFFAISGFYMALILDSSYENVGGFYKSRFWALYPMYMFAVAISAFLLFAFDIHPLVSRHQMLEVLSDPAGFFLVLWTSLCVVGQELLFSLSFTTEGALRFVSGNVGSLYNNAFLVQAWSLSFETVFYLLAPFLMRLRSKTLIMLCLFSLLLRIYIVLSPFSGVGFFLRFFPADFWLFGCGMLSYRFYRTLPAGVHIGDYLLFAGLIGLVLIAGGVGRIYEPFFLPVAAIVAQPFIFRGFRSLWIDCAIGKVTYPFYLLHYTVIGLFEEFADEAVGWHIFSVTMIAAILTFMMFNPDIKTLKKKVSSFPLPSSGKRLGQQQAVAEGA